MEEKRKYKDRKPGGGQEKWKPEYDAGKNLKEQMDAATAALKLSNASVTSYLPYQKGVYFPDEASPEKISVGEEQQRRYTAMKRWKADPTEKNFWEVVLAYAGVNFKTYSGLPFSYTVRKGRNGEYTKELWIDRREKSKGLEFGIAGTEKYNWRSGRPPKGSGRHPWRDIHIWNVLSVRTHRRTR